MSKSSKSKEKILNETTEETKHEQKDATNDVNGQGITSSTVIKSAAGSTFVNVVQKPPGTQKVLKGQENGQDQKDDAEENGSKDELEQFELDILDLIRLDAKEKLMEFPRDLIRDLNINFKLRKEVKILKKKIKYLENYLDYHDNAYLPDLALSRKTDNISAHFNNKMRLECRKNMKIRVYKERLDRRLVELEKELATQDSEDLLKRMDFCEK